MNESKALEYLASRNYGKTEAGTMIATAKAGYRVSVTHTETLTFGNGKFSATWSV